MSSPATTVLLCLVLAALPACRQDPAASASPSASPAPGDAAVTPSAQTPSPGRTAASATPGVDATAVPSSGTFVEGPPLLDAVSAPLGTGPLEFTPPTGWIVEQPTSGMRAAQYRLPSFPGEGQDTTVVVFYFGAGGGGGFDANVARWAGQFEQADGTPSIQRARETSRDVQGMAVREVALEGTYVAETTPGSGQRVREEDWALRGAMIAAPTGPYYARLLGPRAGVERWEPTFRTFIGNLRPGAAR